MSVSDIRSTSAQFLQLHQTARKVGNPNGVGNDSIEKATPVALPVPEEPAALTKSEKDFFEDLFPASVADIRAYQSYRRDGIEAKPQQIGTVIDRRG